MVNHVTNSFFCACGDILSLCSWIYIVCIRTSVDTTQRSSTPHLCHRKQAENPENFTDFTEEFNKKKPHSQLPFMVIPVPCLNSCHLYMLEK